MTASKVPAGTAPVPPRAVRARDVITSEWTKLCSVPSTYWTLLIAVVTPSASAPPPPPSPTSPRADRQWTRCCPASSAWSTPYWPSVLGSARRQGRHRRSDARGRQAGRFHVVLPRSGGPVRSPPRRVAVSPGVPAVLAGGIILFIVAMLGLAVGGDRPAHRGRDRRAGRADLPARHRRAAPGLWGGRVGWFTLLEAAHQVTALHPATNAFSPALSLAGPARLACRRPADRGADDHPPGRLSTKIQDLFTEGAVVSPTQGPPVLC